MQRFRYFLRYIIYINMNVMNLSYSFLFSLFTLFGLSIEIRFVHPFHSFPVPFSLAIKFQFNLKFIVCKNDKLILQLFDYVFNYRNAIL